MHQSPAEVSCYKPVPRLAAQNQRTRSADATQRCCVSGAEVKEHDQPGRIVLFGDAGDELFADGPGGQNLAMLDRSLLSVQERFGVFEDMLHHVPRRAFLKQSGAPLILA